MGVEINIIKNIKITIIMKIFKMLLQMVGAAICAVSGLVGVTVAGLAGAFIIILGAWLVKLSCDLLDKFMEWCPIWIPATLLVLCIGASFIYNFLPVRKKISSIGSEC